MAKLWTLNWTGDKLVQLEQQTVRVGQLSCVATCEALLAVMQEDLMESWRVTVVKRMEEKGQEKGKKKRFSQKRGERERQSVVCSFFCCVLAEENMTMT